MRQLGEPIYDKKISSYDFILEMTIEEYYGICSDILRNNIYQRRRVKSSRSIYSTLREDLKTGCVMPPIVLALSINVDREADVCSVISDNKEYLVILDGLQRSYTLIDVVDGLDSEDLTEEERKAILSNRLRVELYTGINKIGVLYRMLTLNTGQTRMSTRHQIEIIYSDYIENDRSGVKMLTELDESSPKNPGEYRFRDVVDGYTSYIDRDYLTLDRDDILDTVKSLENLTKDTQGAQTFEIFIETYNKLVSSIHDVVPDWCGKDLPNGKTPYAKNSLSLFNKSQTITGFGAAVGKLIDYGAIETISSVVESIPNMNHDNLCEGLDQMMLNLEVVKSNAKKIGNDQRMYFYFFFRAFLDKERNECYFNLLGAVKYAMTQYRRETM